MIYMATPYEKIPPKWRYKFGVMSSLAGRLERVGLEDGRDWMLDNGEFTGKFKLEKWLEVMDELRPYSKNCKGVVVPDTVGNAEETLKRWKEYKDMVLPCYPKAFVAQDGLTDDLIPWNEFEVFFIGGTDRFKLVESSPWINKARERGKWVHVGRVNSPMRINQFWYVDSVDGTKFAKGNTKDVYNIMVAVEAANAKKTTRRLL